MYQYLTATAIMAAVWSLPFWFRKDLRKAMLWGGAIYIAFLSVGFLAYHFIADNPLKAITPGYWAPPTLFDLGQKTGGYAIEDVLFMFFGGGISISIYYFCLRKPLHSSRTKPRTVLLPLLVGVVGACIISKLFYLNAMYLLINFNFFGALTILAQRRDLIRFSFISGLLFMLTYALFFLLFNLLFPSFIEDHYRLYATSGLLPLGVPLEEYLYALGFGMMWSPLYSYVHGLKSKQS